MINRFYLTILFILPGEITYGQSPKIGDKLPYFTLDRVINSKQNIIKAEDLRGKIAIIEFWGTWCAPCIPAMTHLDVLQKHFSNDLVVIAVSDDSKERLQKFLTKNPISIPLA
ncbi:TlpA family protein disulfide reductase [Dyadobacter frigoris]|uniref:TlpA family protein disulfide reductase n=1 Tax=Dyadobacter frigoris TaxID=2576211 RepID=A0A4U6D7X7_9BACT|nr:TlpA disulfide reductase family protein [Dyadobacter frigoris]TKT92238.1 TlpA family protein disulfide reductase [Dyadobacter frigoris]GLU53415.1 hypothetical protein Dfri01_28760 [Dyadobacter frigoris]